MSCAVISLSFSLLYFPCRALPQPPPHRLSLSLSLSLSLYLSLSIYLCLSLSHSLTYVWLPGGQTRQHQPPRSHAGAPGLWRLHIRPQLGLDAIRILVNVGIQNGLYPSHSTAASVAVFPFLLPLLLFPSSPHVRPTHEPATRTATRTAAYICGARACSTLPHPGN